MPTRSNLADPNREPTDEELMQLSHEAFADVRARRLSSEAALRRRVAERRAAIREKRARRRAEGP